MLMQGGCQLGRWTRYCIDTGSSKTCVSNTETCVWNTNKVHNQIQKHAYTSNTNKDHDYKYVSNTNIQTFLQIRCIISELPHGCLRGLAIFGLFFGVWRSLNDSHLLSFANFISSGVLDFFWRTKRAINAFLKMLVTLNRNSWKGKSQCGQQ